MFVALTMLGALLAPPIEAPKEIVIKSTQMNVLENDALYNFTTYRGIQTVRSIPANREEHIQSFQKALQEYQERLKREEEERLRREEEARLKAEQEERERQEQLERERQEQQETESWKDGEFTAYYPANDSMEGGMITATGYNIGESIYYEGYRVIAADPSIPLYSLVDIKIGDTIIHTIVLDRGGRIRGNLFDVTFPDEQSSIKFGRQYGTYKIVRVGKG